MISTDYMGVYYDDCFIPELAEAALTALAEFSDDTLACIITCTAYCAETELNRN